MKCKTPGCNTEAAFKGICRSCYGVARKLIDANRTTWDQLYQLGLVDIDKKPFELAFEAALHKPKAKSKP